jgi:hypothetical protein
LSWPWPADSPLDRARRVARSYRELLLAQLPDACRALDEEMIRRGQGWVLPQVDQYDPSELLTADEAALFCNVEKKTLYEWRRRGLKITATPDGTRYKVADLVEYQALRRTRRRRGKVANDSTVVS